jgi:hypothetical protein
MAVRRYFRSSGPTMLAFVILTASVAVGSEPVRIEDSGLVESDLQMVAPANHTLNSVTAFDLWVEPEDELTPIAVVGDDEPADLANCDCGSVSCDSWSTPRLWAQADMLVWWLKGQQTPALVTTSPDGTPRPQAGVLGGPTTVLHGDTGLDDNHRYGMRATLGYWLDDCGCTAAEVTWFSLGDGANSGNFYAGAFGTPLSPILARPFFDVVGDQQNSELVAFPDVLEGSVEVLTSSEMHSVATLLRRNLRRSCGSRLDFVGGYRYLRFREGLTVYEDLTSTDPGGIVAVGTQIELLDSFSTENDFHGGEFGLSAVIDRGQWSLDALAKIAFGNMHQTISIDGSTSVTVPNGTPVVSNGGLLALSSNIGTYSQDSFAMIPELNLNLRYRLNCRTSLTAGYSLLWITDVARAGEQIDFGVNTSQLPANGGSVVGPNRPDVLMSSTSMWAQGLNFGLLWEY